MMRIAASMVVMAVVLGAGDTHAAVYRWVDDHGQVHYTQTPPPPENKDRGTEMRTTGPATGARQQAQQRSTAIGERLKALRENRETTKKERSERTAEIERKATNCSAARSNLAQLENRRLRRVADADGNVAVLTEEARQERMAEAREQISKNCE